MSMKGDFAQAISLARKNAHLTQECAAEALGLSRRVLVYYEAGEILPCDEVVAKMMQVYGSKYLGYSYISTCTLTGKALLPRIKPVSVSSGAIQLRINLKKAINEYEIIEDICSDDVIRSDETPRFRKCVTSLDDLIASIISLKVHECCKNKKKVGVF
ncbi:MAG: helix-turn-helix domain-containing protein [Megasphaera cerevisiae]|nr:helix-turn-helix domain-containing protein [Megasphaera cerevisiae]